MNTSQTSAEFIVRPALASDADAWDAFVSSEALATPYHRWAWKIAMEKAYKLETAYWLAEDSSGQIVGVLPAARVPKLLGKGSLCSLPYCDRGEPLGSSDEIVSSLVNAVGSAADHEIRSTSYGDDPQLVVAENLGPGQKVRLLLDLPETADELMSGFKSKHRSQIRKAEKNGLTATVASGADRIDSFYQVFTRNMRDLGSPTHSLSWFKEIATTYGEDCLVGLVFHEDKVIGAGIVIVCNANACIPWASTLREFNRLAPNMLLYWKLLEHVTNADCNRFDFGRSSFGEGTYKFKTQWGARPVPLIWQAAQESDRKSPHLAHSEPDRLDSKPVGEGGKLRRILASSWRRLPLWLSVSLGSHLRRYVSL